MQYIGWAFVGLACGLLSRASSPLSSSTSCVAESGEDGRAACSALEQDDEEAELMSQELLQVGFTRRSQSQLSSPSLASATFPQVYSGNFHHSVASEKDIGVNVEFDSLSSGRVHALGRTEVITLQRNGTAFEFNGTSMSGKGSEDEESAIKGTMTLEGREVGTFFLKSHQTSSGPAGPLLSQSLDASVGAKKTREERLCDGPLLRMYHQTTLEVCPLILATGFRKGRPGLLGSGIYFCESANVTGWKALHWGCIVEVLVQVGNVRDLGDTGVRNNGDHRDLGVEINAQGYDSMTTNLAGIEWAVYYKDQIVDMIAYPSTKNGTRVGDFINGKGILTADKVPANCNSHTIGSFKHNATNETR